MTLVNDTAIQQQAAANTVDELPARRSTQRFPDAVVDRLDVAEDVTYQLLDDADFRADVRRRVPAR